MRVGCVALSALALTGWASQGLAAGLGSLHDMVILKGRCAQFQAMGYNMTPVCEPHMVNENYRTGRSGFTFVFNHGSVLTFTGMGSRQVKTSADSVVQPIDGIIMTSGRGPKTSSYPAVGQCAFTNPYKGVAQVRCSATTDAGPYVALFVTDGNAPETKVFRSH
jgi:hypothetical protein